ncbi:ribose transport system ATP-binding protein [Pseudoxanthobacter soli DSM 19599]|uniref:Ribose transport system ATP-binding protein n=1 Tax=Pseudoxanthobacter soli DSM 19599 TaxID=1123029 RepID=A0A1M7ZL10_9HYPH|nr:sugar ABC transporter ATP-binding protein [Pseudoxanthobacter soli]SHO65595.1 ribose transport system ATP-binding protein [Pseudoxanthobacter soli DSM 19599]
MPFAVYGLRKSYGGVEVLKGVDLEVADGEIHALLGANGAGKSTLIKCLSGAIVPDSGTMMVGVEHFDGFTPRTARQAGISVIYQDLSLAASLDVADNMFLGQELRIGPFVRKRAQRREAARWLDELGVDIRPTAALSTLGNAGLQAVEIAKSLRTRPKVLILDEPTAALSEKEAEALGEQLLALKKQKLPLLYVTHRLAEVFTLADRVTVLRGGQVVLTGAVKDLNRDDLVDAIAGERIARGRPAAQAGAARTTAVSVRGLLAPGIGPVDLDIREGEVLGVFGLVGSGRTELVETLFGSHRRFAGTVSIDGRTIAASSPGDAVAAGVALVPSDRLRKSIIGSLSAGENMLLPSYAALAMAGVRRFARERLAFNTAVTPLNLQPPRIDLQARRFSGGNQQKLVIARWLNDTIGCRLLMLDEPTQGVDVGARRDIYAAIRASADAGKSVLVTSSEPEELVQIADRVVVLSAGRVAAIVEHEDIEEGRLLALAHEVEHQGRKTA